MAKKTRTPPPPRRVQAPKVRTGKDRGRAGAQRRRPSNTLLAIAGAGVVGLVVVIVVIVLAASGGSGTNVDKVMVAAGCTVRNVDPIANFKPDHSTVPSLSTPVRWNSFPPAAGEHYGIFGVWGFYTDPVNPRQVVHNEEHGAVVLWWGPKTPQSTIDELHRFYQEEPISMFGTPLIPGRFGKITYTDNPSGDTKGLGSKVAISAWTGNPNTYFHSSIGVGHVAVCPTFNEKAFKAFRDKYRAHGPEFTHDQSLQINLPGHGPQG